MPLQRNGVAIAGIFAWSDALDPTWPGEPSEVELFVAALGVRSGCRTGYRPVQ